MEPTTQSPEAARRATRVRAQLPVRVTSLESPEFTETCYTLVVNPQGCGVRISRPLEPGLRVHLDQLPTGKVVDARVANCVPLGAGGKYWLIGLALEEVGNVWGLNPAPADWGVDPIPAPAVVAAPVKKDEWPFSQFSSKGEFHPGRR